MAFPNNKETIKKDWTNITPVKDTHPDEHNLVGEVVEALQDKVGIDGDANTDSFDYKLSNVTGAEKAASDTDVTQVQTNLTDHENDTSNPHSVTKTQVGLSDVTNDEQVALAGNQTIAGIKTFSSSPKVPSASASDDAVNKNDLDTALSTQGVAPELIIFNAGNRFLPGFSTFTDNIKQKVGGNGSNSYTSTTELYIETDTEFRAFDGATYFSGDRPVCASVFENDVYVLTSDDGVPDNFNMYRVNNITSLSTSTVDLLDTTTNSVLTDANVELLMTMDSSGDFYFNYQGGASTYNVISKSVLVGDVFQTPTTITCSGTISQFDSISVDSNGDIIAIDADEYERFNSSGVSQKYSNNAYLPVISDGANLYNDGSNDYLYIVTGSTIPEPSIKKIII